MSVGMNTLSDVKEYYGKVLSKSTDLQTNACCTGSRPPTYIQNALKNVHDDVISRYYGCGLTIPDVLEGCKVVDLGCGAGRDSYIIAQLVGEKGSVIGVDMTDEQLEVARKHIEYHAGKFAYSKPNTEFRHGYIECLGDAGLGDGEVDIIVSNCVINLSPDKLSVLREAFRVLKHGGEMYFSDVYADRRIPSEMASNKMLWGECLSGALYWNDFENMARSVGFKDPRLVSDSVITVNNSEAEKLVGPIKFYSATYRLFKLPELDTNCEDYGQSVVYKGTIPSCPLEFKLDAHHIIEKDKEFRVCSNSYAMLHNTRFRPHFEFHGNTDIHYGIFSGCGRGIPFESASSKGVGSSCC